jgi:hypothetical protein
MAEVVSFRRQQLAELLREWSDPDRRLVTDLLDRLADDLQQPTAGDRVPQPL